MAKGGSQKKPAARQVKKKPAARQAMHIHACRSSCNLCLDSSCLQVSKKRPSAATTGQAATQASSGAKRPAARTETWHYLLFWFGHCGDRQPCAWGDDNIPVHMVVCHHLFWSLLSPGCLQVQLQCEPINDWLALELCRHPTWRIDLWPLLGCTMGWAAHGQGRRYVSRGRMCRTCQPCSYSGSLGAGRIPADVIPGSPGPSWPRGVKTGFFSDVLGPRSDKRLRTIFLNLLSLLGCTMWTLGWAAHRPRETIDRLPWPDVPHTPASYS